MKARLFYVLSFLLLVQSSLAESQFSSLTLKCGTDLNCAPSQSIRGYSDDLAYLYGIYPSYHLKNQNLILAHSRPFSIQPYTPLSPKETLTGFFGANNILMAALLEQGLYRYLLDHEGNQLGEIIENHLQNQIQILSGKKVLAEFNWNGKGRIWRMKHSSEIQPEVCLFLAAILTSQKKTSWTDQLLSTLGARM